jgi:hypothetical protein
MYQDGEMRSAGSKTIRTEYDKYVVQDTAESACHSVLRYNIIIITSDMESCYKLRSVRSNSAEVLVFERVLNVDREMLKLCSASSEKRGSW